MNFSVGDFVYVVDACCRISRAVTVGRIGEITNIQEATVNVPALCGVCLSIWESGAFYKVSGPGINTYMRGPWLRRIAPKENITLDNMVEHA